MYLTRVTVFTAGINNGKNFPSEFLIGIYDRIEKVFKLYNLRRLCVMCTFTIECLCNYH